MLNHHSHAPGVSQPSDWVSIHLPSNRYPVFITPAAPHRGATRVARSNATKPMRSLSGSDKLIPENFNGFSTSWLIFVSEKAKGFSFSGLVSGGDEFTGVSLSLLVSGAKYFKGLSIGSLSLVEEEMIGVQIGIVNYAENLKGIQIGILNIAKNAFIPYTIGLNWNF